MTQVTSRAAHSINCEVFLHTVTFFLTSYLGNCTSSAIVCFDDIATLSNFYKKLQFFDSTLLRIMFGKYFLFC